MLNRRSATRSTRSPATVRRAEPQRLRDQLRRSVVDDAGGDPLGRSLSASGRAGAAAAKTVTFPQQGGYVSMPVDVTPMQVTQWNLSYQRSS
jgi:hypothetical protein